MGAAHRFLTGFITSYANILSVSAFSNSLIFGRFYTESSQRVVYCWWRVFNEVSEQLCDPSRHLTGTGIWTAVHDSSRYLDYFSDTLTFSRQVFSCRDTSWRTVVCLSIYLSLHLNVLQRTVDTPDCCWALDMLACHRQYAGRFRTILFGGGLRDRDVEKLIGRVLMVVMLRYATLAFNRSRYWFVTI